MEATRLEELRKGIDSIDHQMIELLAKRFILTEEVGAFKAVNRLDAQDPGREEKQFAKIVQLAESHGLKPEHAKAVYRSIMDVVISRHEQLKREHESLAVAGEPR